MTTYVEARDALVAHIDAGWKAGFPGIPVFYENTTKVDLNTVGDAFLAVAIDFTDATQSDIDIDEYDPSVAPGHEAFGEVGLRLFTKEGSGTRTVLQKFDFLTSLMKLKNLSGVQTSIPIPGRKTTQVGWMTSDLVVPFSFYSKD